MLVHGSAQVNHQILLVSLIICCRMVVKPGSMSGRRSIGNGIASCATSLQNKHMSIARCIGSGPPVQILTSLLTIRHLGSLCSPAVRHLYLHRNHHHRLCSSAVRHLHLHRNHHHRMLSRWSCQWVGMCRLKICRDGRQGHSIII